MFFRVSIVLCFIKILYGNRNFILFLFMHFSQNRILDCERSLLSTGLASWACEWKGGTADNTLRNEISPLFARVKLTPPFHKHVLYPIKSIQYRNRYIQSGNYLQHNYYISDLIDIHIDFDLWEFCVVWATHISFLDVLSAVPPFSRRTACSRSNEYRLDPNKTETTSFRCTLQSQNNIKLVFTSLRMVLKLALIYSSCLCTFPRIIY